MRDASGTGFVEKSVSKLFTMDSGFKLDGFPLNTILRSYMYVYMYIHISIQCMYVYIYIYIYMYIYIYIDI